MADLAKIQATLDEILRRVRNIETQVFIQGELTMSALDDLTTQVTQTTTVEASVLALVTGMATQLKAAGTDPAKLAALTSQLQASAQTLANAVIANTPANGPSPAPADPPHPAAVSGGTSRK